ncbi:terminase small subunit [Listeria aquatica]|uniref:Terminase small subunit n=1 Tax=Listeria aquatica TaxID=1494960 RepID=A0A841ZSP9_9LIST|nr:terminase small subunit [Listeria aquatica]MBC1522422.1 terminase small subunit [Listeria aquatica]
MKLTEKQKRFADEYIKCGNGTEAARLAEYKNPEASAKDNLRKPTIKSYIANALEELEKKRVMNYTEAMQTLTSIARGEMEEEVLLSFADGYEKVTKKADINQRISALKELVKRHVAGNRDKLQEELLQAQIEKLKAEIEYETNEDNPTIIMANTDEMLAYLASKKVSEQNESSSNETAE